MDVHCRYLCPYGYFLKLHIEERESRDPISLLLSPGSRFQVLGSAASTSPSDAGSYVPYHYTMAPSTLVEVHREVLFIIANQLPVLARVVLPLTCKRLFASFNGDGRLPPLSASQTRRLLSLLQRDFRDLYL